MNSLEIPDFPFGAESEYLLEENPPKTKKRNMTTAIFNTRNENAISTDNKIKVTWQSSWAVISCQLNHQWQQTTLLSKQLDTTEWNKCSEMFTETISQLSNDRLTHISMKKAKTRNARLLFVLDKSSSQLTMAILYRNVDSVVRHVATSALWIQIKRQISKTQRIVKQRCVVSLANLLGKKVKAVTYAVKVASGMTGFYAWHFSVSQLHDCGTYLPTVAALSLSPHPKEGNLTNLSSPWRWTTLSLGWDLNP